MERRDGLQCGCCGEERWALVWVLWIGEMGCSKCGCCGKERWATVNVGAEEERWAAVSVGAVERRDGLQ